MPKSSLDWLTIASLWLGALLLAIKGADLPLALGAPRALTWAGWSYIPLVLISFAAILLIIRASKLSTASTVAQKPKVVLTAALNASEAAKPSAGNHVAPQLSLDGQPPERVFIPQEVTEDVIAELLLDRTGLEGARLAQPYMYKWMAVTSIVEDLRQMNSGGAMVWFSRDKDHQLRRRIRAVFPRDQMARLELARRGDELSFVGRITEASRSGVLLEDCELI